MSPDAQPAGPAAQASADLRAMIARAIAADDAPPFSDQSLVDLGAGSRSLVSIDPAAVAIVGEGEVEILVDPDARRRGHATRLLERVLAIAPEATLAWAHGDLPGSRQLAAKFGFEPVRELLQLRRELGGDSGEIEAPDPRQGIAVTSFVAERDADDWVELNARSFASHPEQGSVTRDDLDALTRTDWFEADDFLLVRDTATKRLIGYCWLKVEPGTTIGEFYVVGVDPDRQGEGLGRVLVEAGLAHLVARGIPTSSLYVDGDNAAALALYRSLGFERFTIDVQYSRRSG